MRRSTRWALVMGLLGLAACEHQPSATQPVVSSDGRHAGLVKAAVTAVDADRQLVRQVASAVTRDAKRNANQWFGDRKHRNRATICTGMARLIAKHMATYDAGKRSARTSEGRVAAANEIVRASGCGQPAPMTFFGRPMALTASSAAAVPEEVDEWFEANWHPTSWSEMVSAHAEAEGGSIAPYIGGMTEFEIAQFEAVRCGQDDVVAGIMAGGGGGGEGGEDPMMMFFGPPWFKDVMRGCASSVIANIPDIVTAGRAGFFLWGPWGAAGGAAAAALENCIWGGLAGYAIWHM
jgi:hypothetical protein